jgi:4-amino-4-deoxy-L-arabinose transferase-like glycosyltransferase
MIVDKPRPGEVKPPAGLSVRHLRLAGALLIVVYALALLLLVDVKPLWLDEVIQLTGTSGSDWHHLVQHVITNAGGAPLGYIGQHWLISIAGCSSRTARLLSVIAGVGSMALLLFLGKMLELRRSTVALAASLWIVCPLMFRYSLEGRPYMQAMLFALMAVLAQVELGKTRRAVWALALAACLAAAVYSQPYAVFGPLGFAACNIWQTRDSKHATLTFGAYAAAGLSFLPWLLTAHAHWVDAIAHSHGNFQWTSSLVFVLFRECMGDGYFAAVPAVLLALYSTWQIARRPVGDPRMQLVAAVLASIVFALLADARFNYFFAIRQVMYMAPFLLLLMADGITTLWERTRYRGPAAILAIVFIAASIGKDYHYLTDHNEDWDRLSGALIHVVGDGCILLPSGDDAANYSLFRPEITQHLCDATLSARVIIPVHSYTDPRAGQLAEETLAARGMMPLSTQNVGFAKIEVFGSR